MSYLGANELAQYFLIVQIASLVTFIPIKLGNVFQSTFASLLRCNGKDENAQLTKQYHKVAKYTLLLTFSIALTFILFNKEVLGLFANKIALNNWWFLLLILRYFIGSLGNVHAMIIIAKEKKQVIFYNECNNGASANYIICIICNAIWYFRYNYCLYNYYCRCSNKFNLSANIPM